MVRLPAYLAAVLLAAGIVTAPAPAGDRPELLRMAQPYYPPNAQSMDIVGWVLVKFDVNAEGKTENARVLDSYDEGPIKSKNARRSFERNSLKAIKKFRFEEGKPATGLQHRFTFGVDAAPRSILHREMIMTGGKVNDAEEGGG